MNTSVQTYLDDFRAAGATEDECAELVELLDQWQEAEAELGDVQAQLAQAIPTDLEQQASMLRGRLQAASNRFRELALARFPDGGLTVIRGGLRVTLSAEKPQLDVNQEAVDLEWARRLGSIVIDGRPVVSERIVVDAAALKSAMAAGRVDEAELRAAGIVAWRQRMPSVRATRVR